MIRKCLIEAGGRFADVASVPSPLGRLVPAALPLRAAFPPDPVPPADMVEIVGRAADALDR